MNGAGGTRVAVHWVEKRLWVDPNVWIGVSDAAEEGVWRDRLGNIYDTLPWLEGEPNNWGSGENCAGYAGRFVDIPCDEELEFIF